MLYVLELGDCPISMVEMVSSVTSFHFVVWGLFIAVIPKLLKDVVNFRKSDQ